MSKTVTSGSLTFMDATDDQKLDMYISSNHPTVQIFNSATNLYTPDWSVTNLQLNAYIYVNAEDITTNSQIVASWYEKNDATETLVGTGTSLTVSTNALTDKSIVTYLCRVEYQGVQASQSITFSSIAAGINGADGAPGNDAVTFQVYSNNGYALSTNIPVVTLQTFAYIGDVEITAGAIYQWYLYDTSGWSAIANATKAYLEVSREDVSFSSSYMCKMIFGGVEYTGVVTVDDMNDENKVFTTKPFAYTAGDLWIVGTDYKPSSAEVGTLLRAEHTNSTYADSDWVIATKYDEKIKELKDDLDVYNQYFSFDSTDGLKIRARDASGVVSKFSTSLTNERLAFNYGDQAIAYINGTKMNIKEAEIESPLTVTGKYSGSTMLQAPVINIGNFSIVVESNGSLSIVANT